jgi:transcriptional regulator with XRE-family HTH domain
MTKDLPPEAGDLAREVYRRMNAKGLTKKALALRAGLGATYVHDLFRGKSRNPKGEQLARLADALGCSVSDLISHPVPPGSPPKDDEFLNRLEETALIELWRILSPAGRRRMLDSMRDAVPPPKVRKADDES